MDKSRDNRTLIRSGEARLVGRSRQMLYSGFNILLRSVFWSANLNGRSDNLDVITLATISCRRTYNSMSNQNPFRAPNSPPSVDEAPSERIPAASKVLFTVGILLPYFVLLALRMTARFGNTNSLLAIPDNVTMRVSVACGILLIALSVFRLKATFVEKVCLTFASIFAMPLLLLPLELILSLIHI